MVQHTSVNVALYYSPIVLGNLVCIPIKAVVLRYTAHMMVDSMALNKVHENQVGYIITKTFLFSLS